MVDAWHAQLLAQHRQMEELLMVVGPGPLQRSPPILCDMEEGSAEKLCVCNPATRRWTVLPGTKMAVHGMAADAAMDAARVFVEDWAMGREGVCPGRHAICRQQGTVEKMRLNWTSHFARRPYAVYHRGSLYVHCPGSFVTRYASILVSSFFFTLRHI